MLQVRGYKHRTPGLFGRHPAANAREIERFAAPRASNHKSWCSRMTARMVHRAITSIGISSTAAGRRLSGGLTLPVWSIPSTNAITLTLEGCRRQQRSARFNDLSVLAGRSVAKQLRMFVWVRWQRWRLREAEADGGESCTQLCLVVVS